jgi:energy-coupling factor transport system permease protein
MMRTMKITDELTAAAMTKGMDHPGQRTSIYQTRLTSRDLLVVVLFIGYAICIFTFNFLEV